MIDPNKVCLFIPPEIKGVKLGLFERIGQKIGRVVRRDYQALDNLPDDITPIVGCTPELTPLIDRWRARGRQWIYWDRGYWLRIYATDLPRGQDGGYYRWHVNCFQLQRIRDLPDDRLKAQPVTLAPWAVNPDGHIVVASPSPTYERFHKIQGWTKRTVDALSLLTKRKLVVRDKEMQRNASDGRPGGRRLSDDCHGAHCLVTHGSNAAVEAAIMGCPVFVHPESAASLIGKTDLNEIEQPAYPDRTEWMKSLAYNQFNEAELVNGTLWRLLQ